MVAAGRSREEAMYELMRVKKALSHVKCCGTVVSPSEKTKVVRSCVQYATVTACGLGVPSSKSS